MFGATGIILDAVSCSCSCLKFPLEARESDDSTKRVQPPFFGGVEVGVRSESLEGILSQFLHTDGNQHCYRVCVSFDNSWVAPLASVDVFRFCSAKTFRVLIWTQREKSHSELIMGSESIRRSSLQTSRQARSRAVIWTHSACRKFVQKVKWSLLYGTQSVDRRASETCDLSNLVPSGFVLEHSNVYRKILTMILFRETAPWTQWKTDSGSWKQKTPWSTNNRSRTGNTSKFVCNESDHFAFLPKPRQKSWHKSV